MENYVFVIDTNKKPLNPVHPARARELLTLNKAAVFRTYPFVIILRHAVDAHTASEWELKIDPGSKVSGFALVKNNEVFWGLHLEHRGGLISKSLEQRANVRRNRRSRKTRYRKPGLPNQKKQEGWLAPSLLHRVQTTETWVNRILKYVPVGCIYVEKVKFDLQKMQDPEISGVLYQQGGLQGYRIREYLLEKWNRQCAYCGKKDVPLQVEHIEPKAKGGSDRVSNLCLSCEKCNQKKGWSSGDIAKRVDTGEFGRVNPRSKSNSFNFTPFGGKAVSVHMSRLKRVHRKDSYTYTFCTGLSKNVQENAA